MSLAKRRKALNRLSEKPVTNATQKKWDKRFSKKLKQVERMASHKRKPRKKVSKIMKDKSLSPISKRQAISSMVLERRIKAR